MGKFDNKSDDTPPTRRIEQNKTRLIVPENKTDDQLSLDREQLKALGRLESMAPPTILEPKEEVVPVAGNVAADTTGGGQETVLYRSKRKSSAPPPSPAVTTNPNENTIEETNAPVLAWLVIIEGPGRGRALQMTYGMNKIGRDTNQEISLDFGDIEISREQHAAIEYDPKDRSFYLSKGENLVYLNDRRVGLNNEHKIETGDRILVGKTVLSFVPFCGPSFDWSD